MARIDRIACILGEGFEDSEFRIPYDKLEGAGLRVHLIGAEKGTEVTGKKGQEKVLIQFGIDDVNPADYGMLFIPGGYSPDHLRADERFVAFVKAFVRVEKPIAAICHGPQLLITADAVKGRTMTAWKTIQKDLEVAGATVKDEPVVIDDNLITSRMPDDLDAFSNAMLATFKSASLDTIDKPPAR